MPNVAGSTGLDPERLEGQTIAGFHLLRKLAIGGMGTLYRAEEIDTGKIVAFKALAQGLTKDPVYVERFIQEARAARDLRHPNLVQVYYAASAGGIYFSVMELVQGEGLDAVLERRGRLPWREALEIATQISAALGHAHTHGIIHRDIKPDNILVEPKGGIRVIDLGIAKKLGAATDHLTDAGMALGTPYYMAPEQARDARGADARCDVFSLGASLYHMVSGRIPFLREGADPAKFDAILTETVPLRKLVPDLPEPVVRIIEALMARDPRSRPADMEATGRAIRRVLDGKDPFPQDPADAAVPAPATAIPTQKGTTRRVASGSEVRRLAMPHKPASSSEGQGPYPPPPPMGRSQAPPPGSAPGARSPWAVSSQKKPMVVTYVTIGLSLVIGIVGWVLVNKSKKHDLQPVQPNTGIDTSAAAPGAGQLLASPNADHELEVAVDYEKSHPADYAGILHKFADIVERYPNTTAMKAAGEARLATLARREAILQSAHDEARKALDQAVAAHAYGPALERGRDFAARPDLDEKWKPKAQALLEEGQAKAKADYEAIGAAAEEQVKVREFEKAIAELKKIAPLGVEEFTSLAADRMDKLHEEYFNAREEAKVDYAGRVAANAPRAAKGEWAALADETEKLPQDPKYRSLAEVVALDARNLRRVGGFLGMFAKGLLAKSPGKPVVIHLQNGERKGVALEANDKEFTLQIMSRAMKYKVSDVLPEDVELYAVAAYPEGDPEAAELRALYWYFQGQLDRSEPYFHQAAAGGRAVERYLQALDTAAIEKRSTGWKTALDLNSAADWEKKSGEWDNEIAHGILKCGPGAGLFGHRGEKWKSYVFQFKAKKVSGVNGFVLVFRAYDRAWRWVVGDEGNTKSQVRGVPETLTKHTVQSGAWIQTTIAVLPDRVIGYINGEPCWRFAKPATLPPDSGENLGVAVVATRVEFRDFRSNELK